MDSKITIQQMSKILITLGFYSNTISTISEAKLLDDLKNMLIPNRQCSTSDLECLIMLANLKDLILAVLQIPLKE